MSKNVIRHLTDILVCLIEESPTIPSGVMDCIIGQFTEYASVSPPYLRCPADGVETGDPFFPAHCRCLQ